MEGDTRKLRLDQKGVWLVRVEVTRGSTRLEMLGRARPVTRASVLSNDSHRKPNTQPLPVQKPDVVFAPISRIDETTEQWFACVVSVLTPTL